MLTDVVFSNEKKQKFQIISDNRVVKMSDLDSQCSLVEMLLVIVKADYESEE